MRSPSKDKDKKAEAAENAAPLEAVLEEGETQKVLSDEEGEEGAEDGEEEEAQGEDGNTSGRRGVKSRRGP
eukprot:15482793-Heterocapsa_arctica.AAC.1